MRSYALTAVQVSFGIHCAVVEEAQARHDDTVSKFSLFYNQGPSKTQSNAFMCTLPGIWAQQFGFRVGAAPLKQLD